LTEMLCSVAGMTTLDREWYQVWTGGLRIKKMRTNCQWLIQYLVQ